MPKFAVTLKDLNPEKLFETYYPKKKRKELSIADVAHEKSKRGRQPFYIVDSNQTNIKLWANMIDITLKGCLPRFIDRPCWQCGDEFSTAPVGCPIRYIDGKNSNSLNNIKEKFKELNIKVIDDTYDYFETEGLFCSLPCIKRYILHKRSICKTSRYKESLTLLLLMYKKFGGTENHIPTAPKREVLLKWGGHLSTEEYRQSFGKFEFVNIENCKRPYMFSTSSYTCEKKIK